MSLDTLTKAPGRLNVSWVIENITKESSLRELADAVKNEGGDLFEINGDYTAQTVEDLRRYSLNKPTIFDGSINMAELVGRDVPSVSIIGTPANYLCSHYYPICTGLLFNDRYVMISANEIVHHPAVTDFAKDGWIFARPNGGQKEFRAGLFELGRVAALQSYGPMLVIVSSPKNISGEWRFICGDNGIIAFSSYRIKGKPILEPTAPKGAVQMCESVLARYKPDKLFAVDVCADNDGAFWLLELNQFTGAGLYACDKPAIVRAVERLASNLFFG